MSTSTTLLALLEPAPAYGYTLKQNYDRWFARRRPLAFGQVYATLARLTRDGLADQVEVEAGHGPDRRLYRITARGAGVVDAWVTEPQPPEIAAGTLHARVTVALLSGRDPAEVLARQRESHLTRMRALQALRREATGPDLLAVTYELAHLDADLRWIEESGTRLGAIRHQLEADKGADDARG
ncbi:PadR family transcriptional regulator [Jiangella mangrovi]|uniref:DNA-binding PadR family transcriptional regulator n=1 Tax=Jiangella mangrovi TaxID=1524084 RepID=A0A7W9LN02_9ACTN|nr:PadR family transcriptional regulator [Jiangella mangrovi]MBB5789808.1 DNA-binding PadR family transcriptional regulator [Jiangella mangrovi]